MDPGFGLRRAASRAAWAAPGRGLGRLGPRLCRDAPVPPADRLPDAGDGAGRWRGVRAAGLPPDRSRTGPGPVHPLWPGRGTYCVIDGDTFKLGERKVRVVGIDAAEVHARCPAEAIQAERSTAALQRWLNRSPFQMTARLDEPTDRYGRDLRIVKRVAPDGREDRLADFMQAEGEARSYLGGYRGGWC